MGGPLRQRARARSSKASRDGERGPPMRWPHTQPRRPSRARMSPRSVARAARNPRKNAILPKRPTTNPRMNCSTARCPPAACSITAAAPLTVGSDEIKPVAKVPSAGPTVIASKLSPPAASAVQTAWPPAMRPRGALSCRPGIAAIATLHAASASSGHGGQQGLEPPIHRLSPLPSSAFLQGLTVCTRSMRRCGHRTWAPTSARHAG